MAAVRLIYLYSPKLIAIYNNIDEDAPVRIKRLQEYIWPSGLMRVLWSSFHRNIGGVDILIRGLPQADAIHLKINYHTNEILMYWPLAVTRFHVTPQCISSDYHVY